MKMQTGQTMVATMITVVIILILVVATVGFYSQSQRKDKLGNTTIGLVKLAAKDEVCRSNLANLRQSIQVYRSSSGDESNPPTLEDTKIGSDFYSCPLGHEKYVYDPKTGQVHCPHPGHEKF